jgi:tetratricopeptide (TPR) repeat protein
MHLRPSGKPELLQPSVGLYFTEEPPTNSPLLMNLEALCLDIPAGTKGYSVEDQYTLPVDVTLLGIGSHAHYLGKQMQAVASLPDGSKKDLLLINNWDFNWQSDFRYAKPFPLPKGTRLMIRWTFDNTSDNVRNPNQPPKRVRRGPQTTDEMAQLWIQLLLNSPADRRSFQRDYSEHVARIFLDCNESLVAENPNDAKAHTMAGRADFHLGQINQALDHFLAAVKADPKYDRAYYELGSIYLRQNRLAEAREAFENVNRYNPDDYESEGSLGIVFLKQGNLDQAEAHFRAALRINPDDKLAGHYLTRLLDTKARLKN